MSYYRGGFWRISRLGNEHWVGGHSVNRNDWSRTSLPCEIFGEWGAYEIAKLDSYTIPNASCPVCGAAVFFYRADNGGRVFFDPPLGPPWGKHPCTDNVVPSNLSQPKQKRHFGAKELTVNQLNLPNEYRITAQNSAILIYEKTGWHPLLDLKVRRKGQWWQVEGFDPIEKHHCSVFMRDRLFENSPTYIRISEPERVLCEIQQAAFDARRVFKKLRVRGWLGVKSEEDIRCVKAARDGKVNEMLQHARNRSYLYLGSDNSISDVSDFVDTKAAFHWLGLAASLGSLEAELEHAYLRDIVAYRPGEASKPLKPNYIKLVYKKTDELIRIKNCSRLSTSVYWKSRFSETKNELLEMSCGAETRYLGDTIRNIIADLTADI